MRKDRKAQIFGFRQTTDFTKSGLAHFQLRMNPVLFPALACPTKKPIYFRLRVGFCPLGNIDASRSILLNILVLDTVLVVERLTGERLRVRSGRVE